MEILQHLTCAREKKICDQLSTLEMLGPPLKAYLPSDYPGLRRSGVWRGCPSLQIPMSHVWDFGEVNLANSMKIKLTLDRPWTFRAPRNLTKSQVPSLTWISCLQYLGIFKIFKKPSHPSQAMVAHRSWQLLSSMFAKVLLIEWNKMTCLQNTLFSKKKKQSCSGQSSTIRIFDQLVAWLIMIPMNPANGWNHWGSVLKDSIILSLHFWKARRQAVSTERYTYFI